MAKQCKLTHGDFRQIVDCRLSRKGYEKKLEAGGAVRERAAKCIDSLNNDFSRGQLGDEAAPPATGIGKAGMTPWLSIVGIGEDGLDGLGAAARAEVDAARTLVGSARHLAMVPPDGRERLEWPRPFSALAGELRARSGKRVCVLATGDPFCYGVGTTLARDFSPGEMRVHPAPSCFSLVCARLGWSLPDVETLTLHGRPLAAFRAAVQPGMRVLALGHDATTPARVAEMLCEDGYGESRVVVLEHLGGAAERVREAPARTFPLEDVRAFNAVAVECVPGPDAPLRSRSPGLPDDAFAHDGLLTRRVLRAAALSALAPVSGQLLWDVGAGCGSVAVEWMRAARGARAVAVERDPGRLALIERNAERLGVPDLRIVRGEAPAALADLDAPDAVFIGGGLSSPDLLGACWSALGEGGRLVAHAVTVEGERSLIEAHAAFGGELSRIAVSRAVPLGRYHAFEPARPITELAARKRRPLARSPGGSADMN